MCLPTLIKFSVAVLNAVSYSNFEFRDNECRERNTLLMIVIVCARALYTPFSDLDIIIKQYFRIISFRIFVFCENGYSFKHALFMDVNEILHRFPTYSVRYALYLVQEISTNIYRVLLSFLKIGAREAILH